MLVKGCWCLLHNELFGIPVTGRARPTSPRSSKGFFCKIHFWFSIKPKVPCISERMKKKKKKMKKIKV